MKKTYVQDDTGKFVEKSKTKHRHHFVRGDFGDAISPHDGRPISGNRQLREHEKRTGLTNDLDSLRSQANHTTAPPSRREMRDAIADSIDRVSSSGFHREIRYDE